MLMTRAQSRQRKQAADRPPETDNSLAGEREVAYPEGMVTIGRPFRPNAAKIIATYRDIASDPDWVDTLDEARALMNTPAEAGDPWSEEPRTLTNE